MRSIILAAALVALAGTAEAKVYAWTAYSLTGGIVKETATGTACNYQSAISAARKAHDAVPDGALSLKSVDGTCEAKVTVEQ